MPLTHEALFYSSDDDLAERLVPFLRDAVASDQGAIAVTTEPRIALLRERLGAAADAVSFFDASRWYRRPGAALLAWRDAFEQQFRGGAPSVRAFGEIYYGDDPVGIRNWSRYESLVNRAFAASPIWFACAYNTETAPETILEIARRTHPIASTPVARQPSPTHFGGHELGAALCPPRDRAGSEELSTVVVTKSHDLADVRRGIRWQARSAGLCVDTVDDLLLAVTELLRGWLQKDGTAATVRTGRDDGEWFCEVSSDGSSGILGSDAAELGLLVGRIITERVEIADDAGKSLVRFVFGRDSAEPRQRIIDAASELFRVNGVRPTGINAIIAQAGVAKATFYNHFRSKDDLVRLWLQNPGSRWFDHVLAEVEARAPEPAERLTAFFDVLGDWLAADEFGGCPFINTATEFRDADHAFAKELLDLTREVEEYFKRTAAEAGFADPDAVAAQLFLLVPGTITTAAARSSPEAARAARAAAENLLATAGRTD